MSEIEDRQSNVRIGFPSGDGVTLKASYLHPLDVVDGHLHIFNTTGFAISIFAPGMWTAAVVEDEVVGDKDQTQDQSEGGVDE